MKIEEAEKREQTRQKYDEEDRLRKEKEQMVEKKQTLAHDEESLNTQEKVATDAIRVRISKCVPIDKYHVFVL